MISSRAWNLKSRKCLPRLKRFVANTGATDMIVGPDFSKLGSL